ncbi:hypothetical protein LTR28_008487, partial [Elasticomyces elasticus]
MSELVVVATITPAEVTSELQVEQLLKELADAVHADEPETLRYHLHRQTDGGADPVFVMIET